MDAHRTRPDSVGSDMAHSLEIGFDHANDPHQSPQTAFKRFKAIHDERPTVFDESTRNMTTRTAKAIADAFAGKNKDEERMTEWLEEILGEH